MKINYHKKRFKAISNSESGEVDKNTIFHFSQEAEVLWAVYQGTKIKLGTITGVVREDGSLSFSYQHVNEEGAIRSGKCESKPQVMEDGRLQLHEKWRWNETGESGESVIEEL